MNCTGNGKDLVAWLTRNNLKSPATVKWIETQDALCRKCLKGSEMLCSGVRPMFDEGLSRSCPMIVQQSCPKLQTTLQDTRIDAALVRAGFGTTEANRISQDYETVKGIVWQEDGIYRGKNRYPVVGTFKADNRLLVGRIACHLLVQGRQVWHIPCSVAARALAKDMTVFYENEQSDLVIVNGIEDLRPFGSGEVLLDYIEDRIASGKPTWVRVPKIPLMTADQARASAILEDLQDVF